MFLQMAQPLSLIRGSRLCIKGVADIFSTKLQPGRTFHVGLSTAPFYPRCNQRTHLPHDTDKHLGCVVGIVSAVVSPVHRAAIALSQNAVSPPVHTELLAMSFFTGLHRTTLDNVQRL